MLVPQTVETCNNYAKDVISGKIIANKWIKASCERYFAMLKDKRYEFNTVEVDKFLTFCSYLKLSKDKHFGKNIQLEPFQIFFVSNIFGWYHKGTENRVYKTAALWVARKNGKSTLMSAIMLYCMLKDSLSRGFEGYCVATKADQARIVFQECCNMVKQSPALLKRLILQKDKILYNQKMGVLKPLASDTKKLDGLNGSIFAIDETAAHPNSDLWDICKSSQGARTNPLIISISTAGFEDFGEKLFEYSEKVSLGLIDDPQFFTLCYRIDDDDDPFDVDVLIKANPGLGTVLSKEYLIDQMAEARNMPSARVNFLTKHCNRFVKSDSLWANLDAWDECYVEYDIFSEEIQRDIKEVYLGLDLASVSDMCSLSGVAIMKDGRWLTFSKNYLPEDMVIEQAKRGNQHYLAWKEQNHITATPGSVTDYDWIKLDILNLCGTMPIKELAFDRYNSSQLINDLMKSGCCELVAFNQGFVSISAPIKELERRILDKLIAHNNNPVLNFAMSNVVGISDPNGNVKFAKNKSSGKIDPVVALVMAVGRAMLGDFEEQDLAPAFFRL